MTLTGCTGDSTPDITEPTAASTSAAEQTSGGSCSGVPTGYAMTSADPVATAISGEPVLSNLDVLLRNSGVVDSLDSAPALTVLAPIDAALQGLPRDTYQVNLTPPRLQSLLDHHLIDGRLPLDRLAPGQTTRNGDTVVFFPGGDTVTVPADNTLLRQSPASVCGTLETANATVYLIDQVLRPQL